MPLPTLVSPKFSVQLPVSGISVEYRPYIVAEEKVLLIAAESNDPKQVLRTIRDILQACTYGAVAVEDLPMADLEFLFLNVRIKSVGEVSRVKISCPDDGHKTTVDINLASVVFERKSSTTAAPSGVVDLTPTISVTLKPVTLKDVLKFDSGLQGESTADAAIELLAASIAIVHDEKNSYPASDSTWSELKTFVGQMNRKNLEAIQSYIESFPVPSITVTFTCEKCGKEQTVVLKGIRSFFE